MELGELTKEEFKKILADTKITNDKVIQIFDIIYSSTNHRSTPTDIGRRLGGQSYQVLGTVMASFAKKIDERGYDINLSERQKRDDGNPMYFDLFFRDNLEKTEDDRFWIVEMKPNLVEALIELKYIFD